MLHLPVPDLIVLVEDFCNIGSTNHLVTRDAAARGDAKLVEIILDNVDFNALFLQLRNVFVRVGRVFDRHVTNRDDWAFLLHQIIHGIAANQNGEISSRVF